MRLDVSIPAGRRLRALILAVVVAAMPGVAPVVAVAAVGDVDTSFGTAGLVTTEFSDPGPSAANGLAVQADGKLVAVGQSSGRDPDFSVARFSAAGEIDAGFGVGGKVTTDLSDLADGTLGYLDDLAQAVLVQPDGTIVAVGSAERNIAMVRYTSAGALDTTFSGDGRQVVDVGAARGQSVARQSDGKLLVGGGGDFSSTAPATLARFNADGSLDTSFGTAGAATIPNSFFGASARGNVRAIAVQPDQSIVVAAAVPGKTQSDTLVVARFTPAGVLDTTFSGDGVAVVAPGSTPGASSSRSYALALQADGKIVVGGATGFSDSALIARLTTTGAIDTTFSGDGFATAGFSGPIRSLAVSSSGIYAAGKQSSAFGEQQAVARYTTAGDLDTAFSGDGIDVAAFPPSSGLGAMILQADGKPVVAGFAGGSGVLTDASSYGYYGGTGDFALARFSVTGGLDSAFSGDGMVTATFGGPDNAVAAATQPDGKLVVAGSVSEKRFGVARYAADGALDPSFSGDGTVAFNVGSSGGVAIGGPQALAVGTDGRIVVGGSRTLYGAFNAAAVARLDSSGALDNTFSGDGIADLANTLSYLSATLMQPDGKTIVAGGGFKVVRLLDNGGLDPSFDGDGAATASFADPASAYAAARQPDGRIVVVGGDYFDTKFAIARFNTDGSLDASFSGDGKTTVDVGPNSYATAVALQADGKIVVAGGNASSGSASAVARLNVDGALDTSFSGDGVADVGAYQARAVVVRSDGRIVVAGGIPESFAVGGDFEVTWLTSSGTPEPSVTGGGRRSTDFAGHGDGAAAVTLQPSGKPVVVGTAGMSSNMFGLVRYQAPALAVDTTPPLIAISAPTEGARFAQGSSVSAQFSCSDPGGSGVASCNGPATLDTGTAGAKTLTVVAVDNAGNRAEKSVGYVVDAPAGPPAGPAPDTGPGGPAGGGDSTVGVSGGNTSGGTTGSGGPVPLSDGQIKSALNGVAFPRGSAARIAALLRSGFTATFKAPGAGKVQVDWYFVPKGARLAAKQKPVKLGSGATTTSGPGTVKIKIALAAAGKKKLKAAKTLKITGKSTFTPTGKAPVSVTKAFTAKR